MLRIRKCKVPDCPFTYTRESQHRGYCSPKCFAKKKETIKAKKEQRLAALPAVDFYRSRPWLELRYRAYLKYGRDCVLCGSTKQPIHMDHIKPRSKFPELELDLNNLQPLCHDCNNCNKGKSNIDYTDWRKPPGDGPDEYLTRLEELESEVSGLLQICHDHHEQLDYADHERNRQWETLRKLLKQSTNQLGKNSDPSMQTLNSSKPVSAKELLPKNL